MFLDRYHLNLLAIPREDAAVGDLYPYDGRMVGQPGSVRDFLQPPLSIPKETIRRGEMPDISGTLSDSTSIDVGLNLLDGFLSAMGAGGVIGDVGAEYKRVGTAALKFRFTDAVRETIDPISLGTKLMSRRVREGHPMVARGYRYYLVTAVARSPSISVMAEGEGETKLDLNAKAMKGLIGGSGGVSVKKSSVGELTYSGKRRLAFGVEVYELQFDRESMRMSLRIPVREPKMRLMTSFEPPPSYAPAAVLAPTFIGDPDADISIDFGELSRD
jgi:hypothetical protein